MDSILAQHVSDWNSFNLVIISEAPFYFHQRIDEIRFIQYKFLNNTINNKGIELRNSRGNGISFSIRGGLYIFTYRINGSEHGKYLEFFPDGRLRMKSIKSGGYLLNPEYFD